MDNNWWVSKVGQLAITINIVIIPKREAFKVIPHQTDEFSEKFQAAFDHPSFSEKKCCTFLGTHERLRPFPKDGNEQS